MRMKTGCFRTLPIAPVFDAVQKGSRISRSGRVVSPILRNPRLWVMAHKTAKTAVRIHIRIIPFRSDSSGKRAKRERRHPAGFVSCGVSPVFNRLSVAMSTGVDMRSRFSDACENRLRVVQALDVIILRSGVQLVQDGGFLRGILPGLGEHTGFVSCNIGGGVPFA